MSLFNKLSRISRKRKLELFYQVMNPTAQTKVLDIGAEINGESKDGLLKFADSYPWKNNLTAFNISAEHIESIKQRYPEIKAVVGNACNLPWPDKYFDIAYSNAVIEHVGDLAKQKQMALEIMRVAKRWFITTPNRWYPFEFHLRLPFVTWLPGRTYLWVGNFIRYNHSKKKYMFMAKHYDVRLMTAKELAQCFSDSKIIKQRVTFMAETLIVVGETYD